MLSLTPAIKQDASHLNIDSPHTIFHVSIECRCAVICVQDSLSFLACARLIKHSMENPRCFTKLKSTASTYAQICPHIIMCGATYALIASMKLATKTIRPERFYRTPHILNLALIVKTRTYNIPGCSRCLYIEADLVRTDRQTERYTDQLL